MPAAPPLSGFQDKSSTQVDVLQSEFPKFDGRGVTVAVLDSGVDPSLAGLQQTPDGRPKIVNLIDATGDGDVVMSRAPASALGTDAETGAPTLRGSTGRVLVLGQGGGRWANPSGAWYVGQKRAFEFFPKKLVSRMKSERKKAFQRELSSAIEAAKSSLLSWERGIKEDADGEDRDASGRCGEDLEAWRDEVGCDG